MAAGIPPSVTISMRKARDERVLDWIVVVRNAMLQLAVGGRRSEQNVVPLQVRQFDCVQQIRDAAPAWDRLWQRSEVSLPTVRAELVAQWLEHFAPRAALRVLVVEEDGEMVAALPLVGRRHRRVLPVGDLTGNVWSYNGELLLDPAVDPAPVLDLLADAWTGLPWPLVWLDMVPAAAGRWHALLEAFSRRGLAADIHQRYRIGQVQLEGDFAQYEAARSKNLRRQVRKDWRRLERDGAVDVTIHSQLTPDEVDACLRQAFEIEDHSWKGESGQTVLSTPGIFQFYRREARQLAQWGYLRVAFLRHRGEPIAFEVGWTAKGVYHSFKVGYDERYAQCSPGHLLRSELIRAFWDRPGQTLIDFQGPVTEALARWSTRFYPISRVVIAPRRPGSRALLAGYRLAAPVVRRLRARG